LDVRFRNKRLEKCFVEGTKAVKEFGSDTGRRYIQRIKIIQTAKSVDELKALPGLRFHALSGDRAGTYAMNLTGYMRLIVSITDSNPQTVIIEEVSKHYDG